MDPLLRLLGEKAEGVFYDDFRGMLTHTIQHFFVIAIMYIQFTSCVYCVKAINYCSKNSPS